MLTNVKLVCFSLLICSSALAQDYDKTIAPIADERVLLPRIDNPTVSARINDPSTYFYTENQVPRAYQHMGGVHSPFYNISASQPGSNDGSKPLEYFGNGNREFPWGDPAGTQWTDNIFKMRFVSLPKDAVKNLWPVVYERTLMHRRDGGESEYVFWWRYPKGAILGELLFLSDAKKNYRCFEMRIRIREIDHWEVDVFRPFPTEAEYREVVGTTERFKQLRHRLRSEHLDKVAFDSTATMSYLPELPPEKVDELLSREFKSCLGTKWNATASTPSTRADYHIVPKDYGMAFVETDTDACMKCHESTNRHVTEFTNAGARDWYGRIRGSDGILSLHPFDPSCISTNGFQRQPVINSQLTGRGIFAQYDPRKHPKSMYATIKELY